MSFNLKAALDGILTKAKYDVTPDYSQFAVNSYLSKYRPYIPILNKIMCLSLPNKAHYDYLRKTIPYGWPAKWEMKIPEENPILKYIMTFYKCSRLDAKDYLMFMSTEEQADLIDYYEGYKEEVVKKGAK